MTKLYLSLLGLLITVSVFGQDKLSGKIYDAANNAPLGRSQNRNERHRGFQHRC